MATGKPSNVVAALAGRRIDVADADTLRFPLSRVSAVQAALVETLTFRHVDQLVCSAACGADLLALAAAQQLGIRRRIVLPFDADRFRSTSVVDRPGDWGPLYDRLVTVARETGDLLVMNGRPDDEDVYTQVTRAIVREVGMHVGSRLAIVVWEGRTRGAGDATEDFRCMAASAGFEELTIHTF